MPALSLRLVAWRSCSRRGLKSKLQRFFRTISAFSGSKMKEVRSSDSFSHPEHPISFLIITCSLIFWGDENAARGLTFVNNSLAIIGKSSICGRRLHLWSTGVGTLSGLVTVIALRSIWQRLRIYGREHRLIGGL